MTDWIDDLTSRLNDQQRQQNLQRAIRAQQANLVDALAPDFVEELCKHAETLSRELDEKLGWSIGEVVFHRTTTAKGFGVSNRAKLAADLTVKLNEKSRQLEATTQLKGAEFVVGDGTVDQIPFSVNDRNELSASYRGQRFDDPAGLASALLRNTFTSDLIR